ncbi:MAG: zinc metallopeptidase [Planctomycetota bacterium]|nr:zinc metallopeptidase [Planctomycetota bacterium]
MLSYYLFDPVTAHPLFLIATLVGFGLSMLAQARVKSTFRRFANVGVRSGMTGAEAAAAVCRAGGVTGVTIERSQGFLSDHYDPGAKALRLSPDVYDGRSISSIAVAAHEAGHSIQDATDYAPLGFRSAMVPVTKFGSGAWYFVFLIGVFLQYSESFLGPALMQIGVGLFALVVVFQVMTLPVEVDASRRAKAVLASTGIVSTEEEAAGVAKVLDAAALTYFAAAAASILQLLALLARVSNSNR